MICCSVITDPYYLNTINFICSVLGPGNENILMLRLSKYFQMDKDGNGTISLTEYFAIFEEHGIKVNQAETNR